MARFPKSLISLCAAACLSLLGGHARAASDATAIPNLRPALDSQVLQPAMWKLTGGKSTIYILGSLHALPEKFTWRTPAVDKAIASADVFLFETNIDFATAELHYFIDRQGYLPRGQTLRQRLSPVALEQYSALITDRRLDKNVLDYLRPGVALWVINLTGGAKTDTRLVPGVDAELLRYAKGHAKQVGYLETLQSQFEMIAQLGGGAQTKMLEKSLAEMSKAENKYPALLAAWSEGDLPKLMSADDEDPEQKVLLLDNRNKAWLPKIEALLTTSKTYLITVGAAHLAGKNSVIDLMCQKHWKLQRVQTGAGKPPQACPGAIG